MGDGHIGIALSQLQGIVQAKLVHIFRITHSRITLDCGGDVGPVGTEALRDYVLAQGAVKESLLFAYPFVYGTEQQKLVVGIGLAYDILPVAVGQFLPHMGDGQVQRPAGAVRIIEHAVAQVDGQKQGQAQHQM